ncbi:MAG TPA: hypothetical protein VII69_11285 [Candidatus Eremiobacteraceae bacterium]
MDKFRGRAKPGETKDGRCECAGCPAGKHADGRCIADSVADPAPSNSGFVGVLEWDASRAPAKWFWYCGPCAAEYNRNTGH